MNFCKWSVQGVIFVIKIMMLNKIKKLMIIYLLLIENHVHYKMNQVIKESH